MSFVSCVSPLSDSHEVSIDLLGEPHSAQLEENGQAIVMSSTKFEFRRRMVRLTVEQFGWESWQSVPKVVPVEAVDAPVLIPVAPRNYWLLARHKKYNKNGYHAWHSVDMKVWVHHGAISDYPNRWVTSAEHLNGDFYIYFDKPNDEDPHLIIDSDLKDGKQGREVGMVLNDPSHGSDAAVFRDEDGSFHLVFEDWSPVNARLHSWDSPLARRAISPNGIESFIIVDQPAVDQRAEGSGEYATYEHPFSEEPYLYQVPTADQDAYGDYTMIKVGSEYYLFCDYDPKEPDKSMRIGRWHSDSLDSVFSWSGEIGEGFHPDPTIGFAEGKFFLLV